MKTIFSRISIPFFVALAQLSFFGGLAAAATNPADGEASVVEPRLQIQQGDKGLQVSWPSALIRKDESLVRPSFEIERSANLQDWETVGAPLASSADAARVIQRLAVAPTNAQAFYRIVARSFTPPPPLEKAALGQGGAEIFGYGAALEKELARIGQITPHQLVELYPSPTNYVQQISFDPTRARYWDEFNIPPTPLVPFQTPQEGQRIYDFRLNERELELLKKNGFVVSERLSVRSFAEQFYRIWMSDLPVFISTDSMLQAWHRSYDMMLEELEETYLFENLNQMLTGMAGKIALAAALVGEGPPRESVFDADYLLTVARSLLEGRAIASALGQDSRVAQTLMDIAREQLIDCYPLFGHRRGVDFSQFKVRGHYENSQRLGRYFKCVMWLGRVDLRIGGGPFQDSSCEPAHKADLRELGTAVILTWLLNESGQFERWRRFDQVIQAFVGWTDSMTFGQMGELLAVSGIESVSDLSDRATLLGLQDALERGQYGAQNIRSDFFISPLGGSPGVLPRSFTIFGQKFVPDSWVLSHVVFDSIRWAENGQTEIVMRRVPSALDVAFSVFGNNQVVPDLVERISDTSVARNIQRDGWFYQHNLAALRRVMDAQPWSTWQSNIYMDWLGMLRTLSAPLTTDLRYPEVFRTQAWAMKTLNTQLASWTQLRHDTILYAKQSYTAGALCFYPDGYVDPVPSFWRRLRELAERTGALLKTLSFEGTSTVTTAGSFGSAGIERPVNLTEVKRSQTEFLDHFALVAGWLERIAVAQLAHLALSPEDRRFIETLIEYHPPGGYQAGDRLFNGWYPSVFYKPLAVQRSSRAQFFHQDYGADKMDALVADVHTDVPCGECNPPDPGSVLHEGVGPVNLIFVAVQRAEETLLFAGPVLSHFEFEFMGPPQRWADSQWRASFGSWQDGSPPPVPQTRIPWRPGPGGLIPPNPPWTSSYLVPAR